MFDTDLHIHTKAKSSTAHYRLLLSYLDNKLKEEEVNRATKASEVLHTIAEAIHRRSLVVIFSDMFDSNEDRGQLFAALQHLKYAKHEVVLFHVVDKKYELDFEFQNRPYLFVDMESGEEVRLQSNELKEMYQEKLNKEKEDLKMKCLQYKIDYVEADIRKGFYPILETYLVKRKRMRI